MYHEWKDAAESSAPTAITHPEMESTVLLPNGLDVPINYKNNDKLNKEQLLLKWQMVKWSGIVCYSCCFSLFFLFF